MAAVPGTPPERPTAEARKSGKVRHAALFPTPLLDLCFLVVEDLSWQGFPVGPEDGKKPV